MTKFERPSHPFAQMNKRRGSGEIKNFENFDCNDAEMSFKSIFTRRSVLQPGDPSEVGDLKIENDRLSTTVMILNQKLKSQTQNDDHAIKLRKKNRE